VLHLAACTCTHTKLRTAEGDCTTVNLEEEEQKVTAQRLQWLQLQQTMKKKSKGWLRSGCSERNHSQLGRRRAKGDCTAAAVVATTVTQGKVKRRRAKGDCAAQRPQWLQSQQSQTGSEQ